MSPILGKRRLKIPVARVVTDTHRGSKVKVSYDNDTRTLLVTDLRNRGLVEAVGDLNPGDAPGVYVFTPDAGGSWDVLRMRTCGCGGSSWEAL